MSKPQIEFVHPEDRESTLRQAAAVRSGSMAVSFENRFVCKDGSYKWLMWNAVPITEQQIRDKLTADGFSNIQISPQGSLFETIATKNGRAVRLEIDSQSGTVFQARGADDDDRDVSRHA